MSVFNILLGAVLTAAASWCLGALFLKRWKTEFYRQEYALFAYLVGSALLSFVVFFLCTLGLARKGVFWGVAAVAVLGCVRMRAYRLPPASLPRLPRAAKWLWVTVYVCFGVLYFFNALAPERSPDGMGYHLGIVGRYHAERGFVPITESFYSDLSEGLELLFLFAYSFGRHSSAALVHFTFLMVVPLLMLCWGRRLSLALPAVAGAILFFTSPVVGIDGISAYNDAGAAAVLFAMFYALRIWSERRQPALLLIAGILAGFAYAVKYPAGIAIPFALIYILWKSRNWRLTLATAGCAAIMIVPWMVKNIVFAANPLAPFANKIFPNPYVTAGFEEQYRRDMRHFNDVKDWEIPREVTVSGIRLGGILGPVFLLVPLAFLALRRREGAAVLAAAAMFSMLYPSNIGTRFLIPGLPFWALGIAIGLAPMRTLLLIVAAASAISSWPAAMEAWAEPGVWRLTGIPVREALRLVPQDKVLEGYTNYSYAQMLQQVLPPGERVFLFATHVAEAYTGRQPVVSFQSALGEKLRDLLYVPIVPDYQPTRVKQFRFPATQLTRVRVVQTAADDRTWWSIAELRAFSGDRELDRRSWRVRASANPWDVQSAFDGNPVTRWSSSQIIQPGMFVEIDFGTPVVIDSVRLEGARDQYAVRVELWGAGRCLAKSPQESDIPAPRLMRRSAMEAFRRSGVRYILIEESDFYANDYMTRAADWGMRLIEQRHKARLYTTE